MKDNTLGFMLCVAILVGLIWLMVAMATSDSHYCSRVVSVEAKQLTGCK